MVEFAFNNAKNVSMSYTSFELDCKYYLYIFYEKDLDLHSKPRTAEELFFKFWELMTVY